MKKITVFVFRNERSDLLLFEHEDKTIQLPAGTVEMNEDLIAAGIREACEETGIRPENILASELLNFSHNDLEKEELIIEQLARYIHGPKKPA